MNVDTDLNDAAKAGYEDLHGEDADVVCTAPDCGESWTVMTFPDEDLGDDEFTCPECGRQTGVLA